MFQKLKLCIQKEIVCQRKWKKKSGDDAFASDFSDECENADDNVEMENCVSNVLLLSKYKLRTTPQIIRYVRYNRKKGPENYYRERLMLFMPWRNESKVLISTFDTYEAHYNSLKATIEPKQNECEHHLEELKFARQMTEAEDAYDEIAPNADKKIERLMKKVKRGRKIHILQSRQSS